MWAKMILSASMIAMAGLNQIRVNSLKILHLITRMDRGGSAINTLITATEQVIRGHDVVLGFGSSHESAMSSGEQKCVDQALAQFEEVGGRIVMLPSLMRRIGWHDWQAWRDIRRLLAEGFDLLHTHTSKAGVLGRLAISGSVAVVHTPHGHIFHDYFGRLKTYIFVVIERYLARKSDALIALTAAERDDHLQLAVGEKRRWYIVPSGVDVDHIADETTRLRQQAGGGRDKGRWHAVSVGRLVPIKGMDRLIRAWSKVCRKRPDARLALVGDGSEREYLEKLVQSLALKKQVHFAGWTDPIPWLAEADTFVLLSHNEGMGRVVVEAMAASLPAVVSNVCGLAELVDDSVGRVVDADDVGEVAEALLFSWPERVGKAARQRADMYSISAMVDALEVIYQKVVRHEV